MRPFLTFYTPTFARPKALAQCLASVSAQTIAREIEQIVIVDHVGKGIAGMYAEVPLYVDAVHGRYVSFLCDDDVLAGPTVVEQIQAWIDVYHAPPLVIVRTKKDGAIWPDAQTWPPLEGHIDLNCAIVRADVWKHHVVAGAYGQRYEGDFDFLRSLVADGIQPVFADVLFSIGAVSRGAAEVIA